MRKLWQLLAAASVLAFVVVGPASGKAPHNPPGQEAQGCNEDGVTQPAVDPESDPPSVEPPAVGPDGGTANADPNVIWPPNHKPVKVTVTYAEADDDGDTLSIAVVSVGHSQVGANGAGNPTDPYSEFDTAAHQGAAGADSASTTLTVDAERAGTVGAGRTYEV